MVAGNASVATADPVHEPLLLSARHISKSFGASRALNDFGLDIRPGEVHGLLGENGSGKSTFIKILAGFHTPDPGAELRVQSTQARFPLQPGAFRQLGLAFVHQDLGLIPTLSVLENLRIGAIAEDRSWHLSWKQQARLANATLKTVGLELPLNGPIAELAPVERALVAVARAFAEVHATSAERGGGGILVLDEPTVFLPRTGIDRLFALIREIVHQGMGVLYVSHDLADVKEITDRATVLRDGVHVGTVESREVSESDLVQLIIGRRLTSFHNSASEQSTGVPIATVSRLGGARIDGISFEVRTGEILGVTGLAGSGVEEVPYLLFGRGSGRRGACAIGGADLDVAKLTPSRAMKSGIMLIPADRRRDGSAPALSLVDNLTLLDLRKYVHHGMLDRGAMEKRASELLTRFDVRPAVPRTPYGLLSGGNQQKALLAKWLQFQPKVLLLHEPTQGVDVGARQEIFRLLRDTAKSGSAIVCASTDYEQLAQLCDRVLVLRRGVIVGQLIGPAITQERLAAMSYGGEG
jgi:ribose transport system ATP-binding protein